MVSVVVDLENLRQDVELVSDMVRPIVGPNARLESAVEAVHHRRFLLTVRGEVMDPFQF